MQRTPAFTQMFCQRFCSQMFHDGSNAVIDNVFCYDDDQLYVFRYEKMEHACEYRCRNFPESAG